MLRRNMALFLGVLLIVGCSETPIAPSSRLPRPPAPSPPLPYQTYSLSGVVTDPSGARVASARIEAIDELENRRSSATDDEGNYRILLPRPGRFTVHALKDGYEANVQRVDIVGDQRVDFTLLPMSPHLARISGRYSLTLTTSAACTELPETIEQIILVPATITQYGSTIQVDVGDGYPTFDGTIAADRVSFEYGNCDLCDCCFGHDAGATHIVYISGRAQGSVSGPTISGLLDGTFYYHRRESRGGGPLTTCRAADHRFVLSRLQ